MLPILFFLCLYPVHLCEVKKDEYNYIPHLHCLTKIPYNILKSDCIIMHKWKTLIMKEIFYVQSVMYSNSFVL